MSQGSLKHYLSQALRDFEEEYWGLLEERRTNFQLTDAIVIIEGLRIRDSRYAQWNAALDTAILELKENNETRSTTLG